MELPDVGIPMTFKLGELIIIKMALTDLANKYPHNQYLSLGILRIATMIMARCDERGYAQYIIKPEDTIGPK